MKKIHIYILAGLLALGAMYSCSDSFLDKVDPNHNTENDFWKTSKDALDALPTVYSPIRGQMYGYFSAFEGGYQNLITRADDVWAVHDDPESWQVTIFANTPNNPKNDWSYLYRGIHRANYYLQNVEKIADMDNAVREGYKGEVYFLRGLQYFLVVTNFEKGVLRTTPVSLTNEVLSPAVESAELWMQVEKDLTAAAERLPVKRPETEAGRIIKSAAVAYLGKAYLEQGKLDEAYKQFNRLINDPDNEGFNHQLMPNYKDNFTEDKEFNAESIYEINYYPHGTAGAWGQEDDNSVQGMALPNFFGSPISGGWFKVMPTPYIIKEYLKEERPSGSDTRFDKRMYANFFFDYSDYEANLTNADIKNEVWYGDGTEENPGHTFNAMWTSTYQKRTTAPTFPGFPTIDGVKGRFLPKKYTAYYSTSKNGDSMYSPGATGLNLRVMRYAEVLLMQAEVAIKLNNLDEAKVLINKIRERAGLSTTKTWSGSDDLWKEMQHQKLLEFWFEGQRFYDLKRWYSYDEMKDVFKANDAQGQGRYYKQVTKLVDGKEVPQVDSDGDPIVEVAGVDDNFKPKHLVYPVPADELKRNTDMTQHPLWR